MTHDTKNPQESKAWANAMKRWRRVAWLVILTADAGLLAWGAMAAALPDLLPLIARISMNDCSTHNLRGRFRGIYGSRPTLLILAVSTGRGAPSPPSQAASRSWHRHYENACRSIFTGLLCAHFN
jgi:hypothetical protein